MKAHTLAATTFRIIAVISLCFNFYRLLFELWLRANPDGISMPAPFPTYDLIACFVLPLILYAAASVLAKITVWKISE
jgi:hypothetical protein